MKARKRCKWPGCHEKKGRGRGRFYCDPHQRMSQMIESEKRSAARRRMCQVEADALAEVKVEDAAHLMAVRMLAGKA